MGKIKSFLTGHKLACILTGIAVLIVIVACICAGCYARWYYNLPKFADVTIELGTDSVELTDFMTEYAKPDQCRFVTDMDEVDLSHVGPVKIVLAQGRKEESVYIHIADTVAPEVVFVDKITASLDYVPDPEDFVVSASDLSEISIYFEGDQPTADTYQDLELTVVVEDASHNRTTGICELAYQWLRDSYTLELGDTLTKEDLLLDPTMGTELIAQEDIDAVNAGSVGQYEIVCTSGSTSYTCTVTVQDTIAPELTLQEVHVYENDVATINSFVVSATDASGDVQLLLLSDLPNGTVGTYTVTIEAEDASGNITSADTVFEVMEDTVPPVFSGLSDLSMYIGASKPNYTKGVSAKDYVDGSCEFTYDASGVDYDKAGTYYIVYTASDKHGNTVTAKRKLTVKKDTTAPVISGADTTLTYVEGSSKPNYLSGVSAKDDLDGTVDVTVDDSGVNYDKSGTYTVVYTAQDSTGNKATVKRTVEVISNGVDADGKMTGWVYIDGYYYYYNSDGVLQTNKIVGSSSTGYYYVGEDGVRCTSEEITYAVKFVMDHTTSGQSNSEKLKTCYNYLWKNYPYTRTYETPNASTMSDEAIAIFKNKTGNCYKYAAAFACIAKVLGYTSRVCVGQISSRSGGMTPHGWCQIYQNGSWLYCDPDMQMNYPSRNVYMVTKANYPYKHSITTTYQLTISKGKVTWK